MGLPAQRATTPIGASPPSSSPADIRQWGREVLRTELEALRQAEQSIGREFEQAVELIAACRGNVLLTGMGKAGWVARKISATLASTGTPSHFVHPGEAFHGDLGRFRSDDCVWILSQSGETEEVTRLLPSLAQFKTPLIAMTAGVASTTARAASVVLDIGVLTEACPHGLAPTTSTTVMMALGDAVAISVSRLKGFEAEDFARFHPGGSLGRKMARVQECMRPLAECRIASEMQTVREVLVTRRRDGRRSGAVLLCNGSGQLSGLFTDSDLARLLESNRDASLDRPIGEVMTRRPATIGATARMQQALSILAERKISELPVVDDEGNLLGLVDVTDVVGWNTPEPASASLDAPLRILAFTKDAVKADA